MGPFSKLLLAGAALLPLSAIARQAPAPTNLGPYNASFLEGGIGIDRPIAGGERLLATGGAYTISGWVKADAAQPGEVVLVALGDPARACRCLSLTDGRPTLRDGAARVAAGSSITPGRWSHVAAVSDGDRVTLYIDGRRVGGGAARSSAVAPRLAIAPPGPRHFGGTLVEARVTPGALTARDVAALRAERPQFDLVQIWRVGVGWEWQKQANTGLWRQQDPWTLPQSRVAYSPPVARPAPDDPAIMPLGDGRWQINGWQLAAAPDVEQGGAALSRPGAATSGWHAAAVPGTVLQTLVDRGVYPDPYYGLNNLKIPEKLSRQDYWYRTRFTVPAAAAGRRTTLVFGGVNYAAEMWANGRRLGDTRGAFVRGQFDFVPVAGENVIAVRVSPPPHPGIPHEQSIAGGVGENGGQLAIDGPTFVATEGWDWIPGIRDRNTGLWRAVELAAHGDVRILDPQVVTDLPLPRTDSADVHVTVPVRNLSTAPKAVTVRARFEGVTVEKTATIAPGDGEVRFTPAEFAQLRVVNPRLWWPNGYGEPNLYDIAFEAVVDGAVSDTRTDRFGIREVSYDLSLFDRAGKLRRVNVQTTDGGLNGERLIDVTHPAIKQSPAGWAESLTPAGERSSAVTAIADDLPEPHLTIRVNGVRIAARGGNWGMDDAMKRVSYDWLKPFFRLQKEANMNIIRNWMGNNTEEEFYDLADEHGMMVMNDFWQSTQNFQVEPQDPQLFLANARDTIARYRNHPSIILWFGRNEGVPYPALNEGLDDAVFELDGTRWFTGSSNVVNLQGSGPYNYRPPAGYFTDLASGFSVETGTPSLSTLESVRSYVPEADRWPLSDVLAYHDWHFAGNGDTKTFMSSLATMFGPATSFEDFERKAQMMNLETHKAMYEGFLGHLWTRNSGRLLWMTHPAWPSNAWQIYSWDYDTHAAYYGAKKATQPLHVQLNLPGNELVVLNTTQANVTGLTARTRVIGLDNAELFMREDRLDAPANRATPLAAVPLERLFGKNPMLLVKLELLDADGRVVADNFYWRGADEAAYRALNEMGTASVEAVAAAPVAEGEDKAIAVTLANRGQVAALNAKLTLMDDKGARILPAYYSDNYVALLPGETRTITIRYPAKVTATPRLSLRGWNVAETGVATR
ncbi:glycosyl hydrolase 2 galactose-binding domain-containing protein [Sphingomonas sp.]|uniref:glycosyl hydrolase 2 galactose-binding domain-containing protein n=1 Tax=Sphingomonas sp. TaxID=28214 RepID=UPI002B64510B|nr:LamG-like jellyroll fold domain-containing protein [Sphingomonas sp.]HTG38595.1 LamG-like jellyroll fold domain-containing protein [Sphingomonas sp.]